MLDPLHLTEVFSIPECDRIIEIADSAAYDDAALVRGGRHDNIRKARVTWLDETKDADWIFDRITGTVIAANRSHFGLDLSEFAERAQVAWYGAEAGGHFDWHVDIGDGQLAAKRKLTMVIQLSDGDDYEGGALELNSRGHADPVPRARGDAMLFPAFTLHRVTRVTRGARYSLTTWVHGPAFR